MSAVDLLDEAVCAEQPEESCDLGAGLAAFAWIVGELREEEWNQVGVAEAVCDELASGDRLEKRHVGSHPGAEPADTATGEFGRAGERLDNSPEWRVDSDGRQRVEIAMRTTPTSSTSPRVRWPSWSISSC